MSEREIWLEKRLKELEEAIVMADNRLEAALMGEDICRGCVEVAKSYLSETGLRG